MKKSGNGKKLALAVVLGLTLMGSGIAPVRAAEVNAEANAAVQTATPVADTAAVAVEKAVETVSEELPTGVINWQKPSGADIVAVGVGLPPEGASPARGKALALRAAKVDAARNLLETIKGMQIDSETTMNDLVITSDVVHSKVSGLVQGAQVVSQTVNPDGSCEVTLAISMYGATNSIAAAVVPEIQGAAPQSFETVKESALPQEEIKKVQTSGYTGVVIDASGLGMTSTFAPVIYDTNGRIIYGIRSLDYDMAISKGMVEYATDVQNATFGTRAGDNPLVIKASAVRGGKNSTNPVNAVVSVEDGDKILLANEKSGMLDKCAVVFVK